MVRMRVGSALLLVYWVVMFVGTHLPHQGPSSSQLPLDKLAHLGMFGLLTFLLAWTILGSTRMSVWVAVIIWLIAVGYGALDEWTQGFVPHRSPELRDWLADALGAALGVGAYAIASAVYRRRAASSAPDARL